MIRASRWKRPNGYWYVRYWVNGGKVDELVRTRSESAAVAHRVRREIELNAGYKPIRHADLGDLVEAYLTSMPPKTTADHKRVARRVLITFLRLCGR